MVLTNRNYSVKLELHVYPRPRAQKLHFIESRIRFWELLHITHVFLSLITTYTLIIHY